MRAQQLVALDGPDGVRPAEVPEPQPGEREVLIDVRAAGVTFPELLFSRGTYQFSHPLPFTLGPEVAGIVRHAPAGAGVRAGDRVAALTIIGGYAEAAVAPADHVLALPDRLSFAEGAALPVNYLTALFGLTERGRLRAGETVVVHGAGGGLGSAAVQVARALGTTVLAVASDDAKARIAREAGAHDVLRPAEAWPAAVRERTGAGAHLVFDPVGGDRFTDTIRCLRPGGRALVVGFAGGGIPEVRTNRLLLRNVEVAGVSLSAWMAHEPDVLPRLCERLAGLLREARITPVVGRRLPLDAAAEALRALEERRAVGKIVLDVG